MQTRSAARRAAQGFAGQETTPSSVKPSLPDGTIDSLDSRISRKPKASRHVAQALGASKAVVLNEPNVEVQTGQTPRQNPNLSRKRGADPSESLSDQKPIKRNRRKRMAVTSPTLPADVLPHGLGKIHSVNADDITEKTVNLVSHQAPPVPNSSSDNSGLIVSEHLFAVVTSFVQTIIDKAVSSAVEHAPEIRTSLDGTSDTRKLRPRKGQGSQQRKQSTRAAVEDAHDIDAANKEEDERVVKNTKQKRVPRKTKDNPYGLMPGRTPFPDWTGPSPAECREVHRILTELHGEFKMPDKIPAPSTLVAGCGEVADLVDAMIRTLISGHTAMTNANLAIQDVIATYGQWPAESIGAGSIDWNKVRISDESDVVRAVKRAGLGPTKGKDIKLILQQVFEENQQRQTEYLKEKATGEACDMSGSKELTQGQKEHQLLKIQSGVLTLDHIRGMTPDEAMLEFTKYPGIGVKTASCLILFCLQQPSFAVDTHVWRFCKWLKWVPPKASRDDTYMHGEVRIPDDLKYGLHQLFIRHGKECGRCRSGTVEGTSEWDDVVCPLEHLLDRFDKRKTKAEPKAKKSLQGKKKKITEDDAGSEDEYED